ncbi:metallophosphoesterase [Thalassotalea aquiviva]|uniref:metallophosphoesterase n=1 Tax=Thalassotalea aquiviva TaxID=3242415 RepID=UPI00352B19C6
MFRLYILCLLSTFCFIGCGGSNNPSQNDSARFSPSNLEQNYLCNNSHQALSADIYDQPGIHLYVIGDTGTGDDNQRTSAEILEAYHIQYPLDGIIHTGDIFYNDGITGIDDPYIRSRFLGIYSQLAIANVPWYWTVGNHDYEGSINAIVELSEKQSQIHFPYRYYQKSISKGEISVNLFAVDTTAFILGAEQLDQLAWLNEALAKSQSQTNLIFGHHPIVSNGKHGGSDILKAGLQSLLKSFKVPLYLSGHEHNLEYIESSELPNYLISGAGGAKLRSIECGKSSAFAQSAFGGFSLYITSNQIYIVPVTDPMPQVMYTIIP